MSTLRIVSAIPTSLAWLVRHRAAVAALALFWAILHALAPLIQIKAGLPDKPAFTWALVLVFTLPAQFYLLPMLLAYVDARHNHHPANTLQEWRHNFEARWLRAAAATVLYRVASILGLLLIIPGILILFFLGWMPTYVLVRGGTLSHATRWSTQIMVREWRRVILGFLPILGIYLVFTFLILFLFSRLGPEPSLWLQYRHPLSWAVYLLAAALETWFSLALLALFHQVENEVLLKAEDPDQSRK